MVVFSSHTSFPAYLLIFVFIILVLWIVLFFGIRKLCKLDIPAGSKFIGSAFYGGICLIVSAVIFLFGSIFYAEDRKLFHNIYKKYTDGDYDTVEGYIENFNVGQDSSTRTLDEQFDVNEVHFVVYQDDYLSYFYHPKRNGDSLLNRNGQYVKLKYVSYTDSSISSGEERNYIVEIEFLTPPQNE